MSKNGQPQRLQTLNLTYASVNGRTVRAPLEIWIAALIDSLDNQTKQAVLMKVEKMAAQHALQVAPNIISDFSMPF